MIDNIYNQAIKQPEVAKQPKEVAKKPDKPVSDKPKRRRCAKGGNCKFELFGRYRCIKCRRIR